MQRLHTTTDNSPDACAEAVLETIPRVMQFIRRAVPRPAVRGLSVQQFRTLGFVRASPGASLSDVADYFGLALPTASRLVSALVRRRFLRREAMPKNRRQVRLTLLPAGEKILRSAIVAVRQSIRRQLESLPPLRLRRIASAMTDLSSALNPRP